MPVDMSNLSQRKAELLSSFFICRTCKKIMSSSQVEQHFAAMTNPPHLLQPLCCYQFMQGFSFSQPYAVEDILNFMCRNCNAFTNVFGTFSITDSTVHVVSTKENFNECPRCHLKELVPETHHIYHNYVCINCSANHGFVPATTMNSVMNCSRCETPNMVNLFVYDTIYRQGLDLEFEDEPNEW